VDRAAAPRLLSFSVPYRREAVSWALRYFSLSQTNAEQ
jgi:hypothetical protein